MKKLAIITTHPIQYNAPLFKMLTERNNIYIRVFYTWSQTSSGKKFDPGFGKEVSWDIPLLDGYDYIFSKNISNKPGSNHFKGVDNPNLINEIKDWKADAVLVYGWSFKSHLKVLRYFKNRIPVLFRGDSTLLNEKFGIKKIIRRVLLNFIFSNVDIALYAGIANKKYFEASGLKKEQLVFMPHTIENSRFFSNEVLIEQSKTLRNELKIDEHDIVFLFSGKLDENKNIKQLVNIFIECNIKAHLIIAGSGVLENELIELSKTKNDSIHFLGFQNQHSMPIVYNASDVFILPSTSETWGLSINEAMAAGKAIIASDACGAAYDLIKNNENGFIFPNNDFEALQNKILYFIDNENEIYRMGINSYKMIQEYSYINDCMALEQSLKNSICM